MNALETPWTSVLQNIASNVQEIVRSEVRLAATEIKEEAQRAAKAGISLGAGAVLGLYALGFLLLCAMFALRIVLPAWLSALIIAILAGIIALAAMNRGKGRLKEVKNAKLRTVESVKETVEWTKRQTS